MFRESEGKKHTHKRIRNKWYQTFRHSSFSSLYCCAFRSSRQSLFGEVWYSHPTPVSKGDPKDDREAQVIQETEDPVVGHPFNTWWKIDLSLLGIHTPAHLLGRQGRDLISVSREYWATTTTTKKPLKFACGLLSANRKMKIAFPAIFLVMRAGIGFFFLGAWIILQTCRYHQFANSSPVFGAVVLLEHKLWFFVKLNCSLVCLIIIVGKRSISFTNWIIINFFKQ